MKEKILNTIYKKLCEGFNTKFLTHKQFENEFSDHYNSFLEILTLLTHTYYQLKNSVNKQESSQVVKIDKDEYILRQFNAGRSNYDTKYTVENLEKLKKNFQYINYSQQYDMLFEEENEEIVFSVFDFIKMKTMENISLAENNSVLSVVYLFWNYFHNTYLGHRNSFRYLKNEIVKSPELILKKFQENYLSNTCIRLLNNAENNIFDEIFSGFELYIVNVGTRNFETNRAGWTKNNFQVINNGKKYSFTSSTKDEKEIEGEFINIFILQKKYLIKISIMLNESERTPYIIQRDCEKTSLKNDCEIHIAKHHGNETIIFDTKKEAIDFQTKILAIREGQRNK